MHERRRVVEEIADMRRRSPGYAISFWPLLQGQAPAIRRRKPCHRRLERSGPAMACSARRRRRSRLSSKCLAAAAVSKPT